MTFIRDDTQMTSTLSGGWGESKNDMLLDVGEEGGLASVLDV